MARKKLITVRKGTAAEWTSANPILALGELGLETDTHKLKGGDGTTTWSSLAYITDGGGGGGSSAWGGITGTLSAQADLQAALDAKADDSQITSLQTQIDGKQASGSYASSTHSHEISNVTGLQTALDSKGAALVSGTSIKTVNGSSILGSGDLVIGGITFSSATITIPNGRGVYEYSAVITDATVNSGHLIDCQLAPHSDADENSADMLSLRSITAVAGTGNFTVNMSFDERTSGIIKLRYFKS